jgi:hypothetical protein
MITNSSLPSERLAFAHLAARRFEEAIEWADRALHEQQYRRVRGRTAEQAGRACR